MYNPINENFIKVPCFIYLQAEKLYYSITLPMIQLDRFLSIDNEMDVLKRSQRLVTEKRVKKLINYLTQDNFILPSLTGYINGNCEFEQIENHQNIGYLKLSLDCEIKLFDGQHRASGIISACRKSPELKSKLRKSSITLNLTQNLPLDVRQQFFSDINTNVSKPSISLSTTYDNNNSKTILAHKVIQELNLKSRIEYEKNVINKDDKYNLYTFKAFADSIAKAFNIKKTTEITDELVNKAVCIYSSWSHLFKWKYIPDASFFRKKTINLNNIMITIIGEVTKELLNGCDDNDYKSVVEKINKSSINYLTTFSIKNLYSICIDNETQRIKLDFDSKYKLKEYFLEHFNCSVN